MRKETRRGTSARGTNDRMQFSNYSFSSNTARYRRGIFRRASRKRGGRTRIYRAIEIPRLSYARLAPAALLFFFPSFYRRDYAGYSFGQVISSERWGSLDEITRGGAIDGFAYGTRWYPAGRVGHFVFYRPRSRAVYSLN